jgi:hypothetical protein
MPRDELTARHFNQDVSFDSAETFSLGGFMDEQCWNRLEAYMDHKGVVI